MESSRCQPLVLVFRRAFLLLVAKRLNIGGKDTHGTEQILGAICERFERATMVALDSIVLFPENALNPEALVLFPATI